MNIIEKREMKDVLKYKDIVVLKYKIQYPQIIRSIIGLEELDLTSIIRKRLWN